MPLPKPRKLRALQATDNTQKAPRVHESLRIVRGSECV